MGHPTGPQQRPIRRLGLWVWPVLLTIVAGASVACSGGGAKARSDVHPLSEILASGPTFTEAGPGSVVVLLNTTVPVVCAAAYGLTTAYGSLATDTAMMGSGHQNHSPMLVGLQPDTEYHVRFQGVGVDGTLYRSQDYIYRAPPADGAGP